MKGATDRDRNMNMSKMNMTLKSIVEKVRQHETAWPFLDPVDRKEVSHPLYSLLQSLYVHEYVMCHCGCDGSYHVDVALVD